MNALRTLTKPPPDTNIQRALSELLLDKMEKLGEMLAAIRDDAEEINTKP